MTMEGTEQQDRRSLALGDFHTLPDEVLCHIVELLAPVDVGILACVSSVFYILCNEEPLWMKLCLEKHEGLIEYKGDWKQTALERLSGVKEMSSSSFKSSLHFEGFRSLFLYRRWYRCNVDLGSFALDNGRIERRCGLSFEEFTTVYDGKRPVLQMDLADSWPAIQNWSIDQLVKNYGDAAFKVSQNNGKKVLMRLKDYVSYMALQHDEDPLYIFDSKFGEAAPGLMEDYTMPDIFKEDLFSFLDESERPPFRWLVVGPARSGASWHVDPALTSAWNTLLVGRKRWALYPPGRVPPAVVVHADEDDGDVDVDGPSSLQWWLDVYPLLEDEDKPLECIQLPGETIFVPSGWWHCVLNIDTSVAVTQNFVNSVNLELVCLDMAPGYRHRGAARAGRLALQQYSAVEGRSKAVSQESTENYYLSANEKAVQENMDEEMEENEWMFSVDFLASFIEENPNHYFSSTSKSGYLRSRSIREWLRRLWVARPDLHQKIWKGACLSLDAKTWLDRIRIICDAHGFPHPTEDEQLPVGSGSNPVFLVGGYAIKLYVDEAGGEESIDGLGSELQFYSQLDRSGSQLRHAVPALVASGVLYHEGETYKAIAWDGTGDWPSDVRSCDARKRQRDGPTPSGFFRTRWTQAVLNPTYLEHKGEDMRKKRDFTSAKYPYLITSRCKGEDFAHMRLKMQDDHLLALADFLGKQIQHLHCLPLPPLPYTLEDGKENDTWIDEQDRMKQRKEEKLLNGTLWEGDNFLDAGAPQNVSNYYTLSDRANGGTGKAQGGQQTWICKVPVEWQLFISMLRKQRHDVSKRLEAWGSVPAHLRDQIEDYLPTDPVVLAGVDEVVDGVARMSRLPVWLHMDVMDDNVQVEPCTVDQYPSSPGLMNGNSIKTMQTCHILDFGDVCLGDPLYELVALYLDLCRGNSELLKRFLVNYKLPLSTNSKGWLRSVACGVDPEQSCELPYRAMCYCILHEENAIGPVFKIWKDLKTASTWKEVEHKVWDVLNEYDSRQVVTLSA